MHELCLLYNITHRKFGLVILVIGLVLAYINIYSPILEVLSRKAISQYSFEGAVFAVLSCVGALVLLVLGERHIGIFGHFVKPNIKGRIFSVLLLIFSCVIVEKFDNYLNGKGNIVDGVQSRPLLLK